jgi:hypothetical protein
LRQNSVQEKLTTAWLKHCLDQVDSSTVMVWFCDWWVMVEEWCWGLIGECRRGHSNSNCN